MTRYNTLLKRHPENPIIAPADFPCGNADAVFNCGQTMYKGKTLLLLSVILAGDPAPRLHVAESEDGVHFDIRPEPFMPQVDDPLLAEYDTWIIDPRVTKIDDTYYIIRPTGGTAHALLYRTTDFKTCEFMDCISLGHNRVPCLFPEKIGGFYYRLDRPSAINNPGSIWISRSPDLLHWGHFRPVLKPFIHWASSKIGPTPPIRTEKGWLEIFHGVLWTQRKYSLGAILLDLADPGKIVGKMNSYILTPETDYEQAGVVPDVCFTCGAIADLASRRLRVYYGAADTCIGLAECDLDELIESCVEGR
ncbi:MAG: glycoside hydrolase family 130 protein [Planctomycetota bacterium]